MFPGVDPQDVSGVGNAAGAGAIMALISQPQRDRARVLAQRMRYMELAAHPDFKNAYVEGITFTT
jgi:uncharacterized 2Fe-2S/4Fe-4S cluster protein (DUF4445 family)